MSNTLLIPGYRICEYRLIVPLGESLRESIAHLRRQLHEKYRLSVPFEVEPSLTVMHCHAYEGCETALKERMQQVASRVNSFSVALENFAALSSHTIYINTSGQQAFHDLARELKVLRSLISIPDHDPHFIADPHLLIAQDLKPFQFIRMWMDCEHKPFTGQFLAEGMVLLKRSVTHHRFEELDRFDFACLAHCIKQGTLFE